MTLRDSFSQRLLRPVLSDLAVMTTMLLVFLIVFERRADRLVAFMALVTAAAAFAAHYVLSGRYPQLPFRVINHSASFLLIAFATFVILRNIFAQRVVGGDDVLGAVCGYLLAAGAWGALFLLIETFRPGSFRVSPGFSAGLDTWVGRIAVLSNVSLGSLTRLVRLRSGSPATRHHIGSARSVVRPVLHCGRGGSTGWRTAFTGAVTGFVVQRRFPPVATT